MQKADVLELMGSPVSTSRKYGADRWYYYIKPGNKKSKRVLYFDEGFLIYRGRIIPPPISAEEADMLKEPKQKAEPMGSTRRSMTDEELRALIKKEIRKKKRKKKRRKRKKKK